MRARPRGGGVGVCRYDAQKAAELEEYARFQAEEDKRQAIIESERKRLLLEHAVRLMEFLPKGTLQRPEDLEMLVSVLMVPAPLPRSPSSHSPNPAHTRSSALRTSIRWSCLFRRARGSPR